MKEIYCDNCNKDFHIKQKTKTHKITIKETYFNCPHCKTKYTAFVTDPECRKLQKRIRELRESKNIPAKQFAADRISEDEYIKAIDIIQEDIKRTMRTLEPKMNQLKEQYK